jgi:excisionase family DNA binding protein
VLTSAEVLGILSNMQSDLPTSAAARELSVHPDTLKRWATDGKVPYWRTPGGHMRFKRSDIEKMREPHDLGEAS